MRSEHDGKRRVIAGDIIIGDNGAVGFRAVQRQSLMPNVMPRYARALVRWHAADSELE